MGNRWQAMFAIGEVTAILVVTAMFAAGIAPELLWRVALGLGAVPAFVLLMSRLQLPETAVWLIQKGRFREARALTRSMYGEELDMLPDADVAMPTTAMELARLRDNIGVGPFSVGNTVSRRSQHALSAHSSTSVIRRGELRTLAPDPLRPPTDRRAWGVCSGLRELSVRLWQ